jgi:hypothetical protein
LDVLVSQTRWFNFWPMWSAKICSVEPSSAKLDGSVSETGGFKISRSSDKLVKMTTTEPNDWRTPLVHYLENPGHIADKKVRWQALKYVVLDNNLYR